ncbi:hypothetical protein B0H10DRAFT_2212019 [Mycena sp. CBHHK59/15]|nr:hypothetical protein B0H10DRAFT_2212019 [Mycena sp. CBHHK59/15]
MYNINVDVAAVLQLVGTALLHAYRKIHVSVPAIQAVDADLADAASIMGKCNNEHGSLTDDEEDSLKRDLFKVQQEEVALESAPHWEFHAIKEAFKVEARAKRLKIHAIRIATNAKFRLLFGGYYEAVFLQDSNKPETMPTPKTETTSNRTSESTLRDPPAASAAVDLVTDLLARKRAAPPCSCSHLVSQLNPSVSDLSKLIAELSQGIVEAQSKLVSAQGAEACHANESALAQLVIDLLKSHQEAHLTDSHNTALASEAALIQGLMTLFRSASLSGAAPKNIETTPVAVACY